MAKINIQYKMIDNEQVSNTLLTTGIKGLELEEVPIKSGLYYVLINNKHYGYIQKNVYGGYLAWRHLTPVSYGYLPDIKQALTYLINIYRE
jgi:hypothetical protein